MIDVIAVENLPNSSKRTEPPTNPLRPCSRIKDWFTISGGQRVGLPRCRNLVTAHEQPLLKQLPDDVRQLLKLLATA